MDGDSDMDSGVDVESYRDSDMESISSSTYTKEYGGRRYHGFVSNPYPLPNDDDEKIRLDDLHRCYRALLGTNIVPPIRKKPTQILDVGTGSGGWVLEVADEYPGARVYGIDISAIQPTFVPGNAEFIVMDLTNGLDFDDGSTDFVHSRVVHAGVKNTQWPFYLQEVYRILKPKYGWAQMMETAYPHCISDNNSLPEDAALSRVSRYVDEYYRKGQGIMIHGEKIEQLMIDVGFVDVNVRKIKFELGDWGQDPEKHEVGRTCQRVWAQGMKDISQQLIHYIPNDEEREEFGEAVKNDILNSDYHLYCLLYVVIARKPSLES